MNAPNQVTAIMPWEPPSKQAARARLLKAQRLATTRAMTCQSPLAQSIFNDAVHVSGAHVFAPASEQDLVDLANALVRLFLAANTFERLGIGAPPECEGAS